MRRNGKDWHGHWEAHDGRLRVMSAWGSRTEALGSEPTARAQALMEEIMAEAVRRR